MKTILISIGAIAVLGLLVLAYRLTGPVVVTQAPTGTSTPAVQNTVFPVASSVQSNTSAIATSSQVATMSIAIVGGGSVQTDNFIADPETAKDPINPGYYYLGYHQYEGMPDPTVTTNPPYVIAYISSTQYFNIALLQEPIGSVRIEAEQYLMAHLGISQDQMCLLNYMVSVPDRVNSQFSGRNLGFSFCQGATVLPK
ncbi:MAG: hypothetical protein WCW36_02285 [Candidatus Paceibacterota bacterium]|jgi:hypothetical protein